MNMFEGFFSKKEQSADEGKAYDPTRYEGWPEVEKGQVAIEVEKLLDSPFRRPGPEDADEEGVVSDAYMRRVKEYFDNERAVNFERNRDEIARLIQEAVARGFPPASNDPGAEAAAMAESAFQRPKASVPKHREETSVVFREGMSEPPLAQPSSAFAKPPSPEQAFDARARSIAETLKASMKRYRITAADAALRMDELNPRMKKAFTSEEIRRAVSMIEEEQTRAKREAA